MIYFLILSTAGLVLWTLNYTFIKLNRGSLSIEVSTDVFYFQFDFQYPEGKAMGHSPSISQGLSFGVYSFKDWSRRLLVGWRLLHLIEMREPKLARVLFDAADATESQHPSSLLSVLVKRSCAAMCHRSTIIQRRSVWVIIVQPSQG